MKTAEAKHTSSTHSSYTNKPFFQRNGESAFFSDSQTDFQTKPFFSKQVTQPFIQTKLTIGQPGDQYEQEADAMADRVVQRLSNPETVQTKPATTQANGITPLVQPKCKGCEEEEQLQKKDEEEDRLENGIQRKAMFESDELPPEEEIQRKCAECLSAEASAKEGEAEEKLQKKGEADSSKNASMSSLESRLSSSKGSGSPLPDTTRGQMESSFGADFSNVRIHTGSSAVQMNQGLHAQAFTHGSDIYFSEGKYNPNSSAGNHLLAHELTHTLQQGGALKKKHKEPHSNGVPEIQCVAPLVIWGGRYLAGRLIRYGIRKALESEQEMVSVAATIKQTLLEIPIDLMGQTKFKPPSYVADHIQTMGIMANWYQENKEIASIFGSKFKDEITHGPKLNIKFGSLGARNGVPIRWDPTSKTYEMLPHFMLLHHPAFNTEGQKNEPLLALGIDSVDSSIYGGIASLPKGFHTLRATSKAAMRKMMDKETLEELVWGEDYEKEYFRDVIYLNDIIAGNLVFHLSGYQTTAGNQLLAGALVITNEIHAWAGDIVTKIKGIEETEIPVKRDAKSRISGKLSGLTLSEDWNIGKFKASLEASYINGLLDIRGDATYSSDRIPQGNLTLWITTKQQAWEAAEKRLPPKAKKEEIISPEDELAITGWGSMEIILIKDKPSAEEKGAPGKKDAENFLTGKVAAVVDPDGYLTMSGSLIMKNKVRLLDPIGGDLKDIAKIERRRMAYVPVYVGVGARIMGEATLRAGYQIGPVELYEISVSGIYSTNPDINKQLELSARINGVAGLKAEADLTGDVELRLGTRYDYLGLSPAKVSFSILASGALKGFMDFAPTIGIKKEGGKDKGTENAPRYYFKGSLTVGGELDLEAAAKVRLEVVKIGFDKEYPFAKRTVKGVAVTMDWDYTIGDPLTKESLQKMTKIKKGGFAPAKMLNDMFSEKKAKETDEITGQYKEGKKTLGTVGDTPIPIPDKVLTDRVVQDDFKMLDTIHYLILYFDSKGKPPELKMASDPEVLLKKIEIARNRLAGQIPNLDAEDKNAMEERLQDLDRIKRAANKVIKHATALGVGMPDIHKSNIPGFEELGDFISDYGERYNINDLSGQMPAGEMPGTLENPFEIVWPKPPTANYAPLYFGGRIDKPRTQSALIGLFTKGQNDETGNPVKKYTPHTVGNLPDGEQIGISRAYRIFNERIIGPLSTEGTPGGEKLNRILKRYGFIPSAEDMDADHVQEIQFGGKDVVENMWPLDSEINSLAGNALQNGEVTYPKTGRKVAIRDLKKRLKKYYFIIKGFNY